MFVSLCESESCTIIRCNPFVIWCIIIDQRISIVYLTQSNICLNSLAFPTRCHRLFFLGFFFSSIVKRTGSDFIRACEQSSMKCLRAIFNGILNEMLQNISNMKTKKNKIFQFLLFYIIGKCFEFFFLGLMTEKCKSKR